MILVVHGEIRQTVGPVQQTNIELWVKYQNCPRKSEIERLVKYICSVLNCICLPFSKFF